VWRGGGVAHGPHPRSYAKKIPHKVARLAFRSAFSDLIREGRVRVLDQLVLAEPKTKSALALLKTLGIDQGALILVDKLDKNLLCAVRNLQNVEATTAQSVSTYQLLRYPVALITRAALEVLQARLAGDTGSKS
jgi:large subunit ribosomal protein L4